jgi:hypothetical protein
MKYSAEQLIRKYVELRTRKKDIEARHKKELEDVGEGMELIESALLSMMHDQETDSMRTKAGTAYISEIFVVQLENEKKFTDFCIQNGFHDLMNVKPVKGEVKAYKERQKQEGSNLPPIPGIKTDRINNLCVRKK